MHLVDVVKLWALLLAHRTSRHAFKPEKDPDTGLVTLHAYTRSWLRLFGVTVVGSKVTTKQANALI